MDSMREQVAFRVGSAVNSLTSPTSTKESSIASPLSLFSQFSRRSSEVQLNKSRSQNSKKTIILNSVSRGGWSPSLRPDLNYIDQPGSYAIGEGYFTGSRLPTGDLFRNFLSFKLPRLKKGETVIRGTLQVTRFNSAAGDPVETLGFFDVSTPFSVLSSSVPFGASPSIYEDLGSGKNYGLFSVSTVGNLSDLISFRLNGSAVKDINRSRPRLFSIGSSIQSLNDTGTPFAENLFTLGNASGVVRLVLQVRTKR
jgi:hypothetical protein